MTARTRMRSATSAALVALVLAAGGFACSSDSGDEVGAGEDSSGTVVTTTPRSTTVPPAACNDENLFVAVSASYGAAAIQDRSCSSTAALATLEGEGIPDGVGLGIFVIDDQGSWTLTKVVAIDADLAAELPDSFPGSLATAWRKAYQSRTEGGTEEETGAGGAEDEQPGAEEPPPEEPAPEEPAPEEPAPEQPPAPTVPPTVPPTGGGGGFG